MTMNLWTNLLYLSAIHILMAMVPGPNTVAVSYFAAARSRRAGLEAAAGVTMMTCLWVTLSLAGVGIVLLQAGALYRALRWLGAGYLLLVGLRMLWAAWRAGPAAPNKAAPRGRTPWIAGILTNLSNPKSAVFWTSVFALIFPAQAPWWFFVLVIGVVAAQSAAWYSLVALVLSTPAARKGYAKLGRWIDALAGTIMVMFGLRLAYELRAELVARATL
jgi:threonine efflux protein